MIHYINKYRQLSSTNTKHKDTTYHLTIRNRTRDTHNLDIAGLDLYPRSAKLQPLTRPRFKDTYHLDSVLLLPPDRLVVPNRLCILSLHPRVDRNHVRLDKPLQIMMGPRRAILPFVCFWTQRAVVPRVLPRLARELFDGRVQGRQDSSIFGRVV